MADLKTNYVDDVLDSSKNQLRKYQQIQNDDGTVSFVDVTEYSTTGTSFGAKDINDTNAAVNELNESLGGNTLGTIVSLTQNVDYTCPCTGYFQIQCGYEYGSYAKGVINNNVLMVVSSSGTSGVTLVSPPRTSVIVKKGMVISFNGVRCGGNFIPLI